jgi:hypothetical protein
MRKLPGIGWVEQACDGRGTDGGHDNLPTCDAANMREARERINLELHLTTKCTKITKFFFACFVLFAVRIF